MTTVSAAPSRKLEAGGVEPGGTANGRRQPLVSVRKAVALRGSVTVKMAPLSRLLRLATNSTYAADEGRGRRRDFGVLEGVTSFFSSPRDTRRRFSTFAPAGVMR